MASPYLQFFLFFDSVRQRAGLDASALSLFVSIPVSSFIADGDAVRKQAKEAAHRASLCSCAASEGASVGVSPCGSRPCTYSYINPL